MLLLVLELSSRGQHEFPRRPSPHSCTHLSVSDVLHSAEAKESMHWLTESDLDLPACSRSTRESLRRRRRAALPPGQVQYASEFRGARAPVRRASDGKFGRTIGRTIGGQRAGGGRGGEGAVGEWAMIVADRQTMWPICGWTCGVGGGWSSVDKFCGQCLAICKTFDLPRRRNFLLLCHRQSRC